MLIVLSVHICGIYTAKQNKTKQNKTKQSKAKNPTSFKIWLIICNYAFADLSI